LSVRPSIEPMTTLGLHHFLSYSYITHRTDGRLPALNVPVHFNRRRLQSSRLRAPYSHLHHFSPSSLCLPSITDIMSLHPLHPPLTTLATSSYLVSLGLTTHSLLARPSILSIYDRYPSPLSPYAPLLGLYFVPQQLLEGLWLYKL